MLLPLPLIFFFLCFYSTLTRIIPFRTYMFSFVLSCFVALAFCYFCLLQFESKCDWPVTWNTLTRRFNWFARFMIQWIEMNKYIYMYGVLTYNCDLSCNNSSIVADRRSVCSFIHLFIHFLYVLFFSRAAAA